MSTRGNMLIDADSNCQCLSIKTIQIGDWDMNATASKSIAHGLTLSKIRHALITLINDAGTVIYPLIGHDGAAACADIDSIDATNINVSRAQGGDFDNTDFDATSYNRGWITIFHIQ